MSNLIVSQDNEKIVLVDGTTIEIDTGMFNDPLGFIVTEAAQHGVEPTLPNARQLIEKALNKNNVESQE